ncbi:flagellar motor protein MotB [Aquabacterium humicola]|uniref:flagellar motor protein MotB n=1 Tax=Aquabacterium humicola TaxID=3237377 RepID=UPI002543EA84|nr:flagellar motor protein MotB [Rubrivivax pictus]
MAGDAKKLQPIIIKRVKKGGHGHHGGAWKIAYADFVTAMMAFFLLMWLLGSTTEGDKKGIADYFASPLKVALLGGGSGSGDSSHVVKGGGQDLSRSNGQVRRGDVEATRSTINLHVLKEQQRKAEASRLEQLKDQIENDLRNNAKFAQFSSQIKLDMTKDGLRIQIVDEHQRPMFDVGSASVKPYMRELLRAIGAILVEVPNRLTLEGHTDATPFGSNDRGYSNWELSSDRANASRRELMAGGLAEDRVLRVQGLASSAPFIADDPLDPQNRRISIIVMNRDAEDRFFRPQLESAAPEPAAQSEPSIRPERPMVVSSQPIVGR